VNGEYYLIDTGKNKLKEPFKKKVRAKVDIFFGEIPLMTEEGTFILNGCERVIISQIIRSPGVYFRKEFGTVRKTIYTATIISNKGLWTKIILDQTDPKKEKNTNLLEMIVQNTSKANELTLRNMTYGGGMLAAEGVSSVQMANYRSVSSPRINATNDMVRGIKKEVNATVGSNFLNFSPRRS
jgi:DNA-directed RNA polymerase beta subunit